MLGYRRAIALMFLGLGTSMALCYSVPRPHEAYLVWDSVIGFFSGVFGLFTMYLPPLFPTLLRTTGAGFCFNFGRIAAAGGTIYFGLYATVGDFSRPLFLAGCLFAVPMLLALFMREPEVESDPEPLADPVG
jgi:MFS family permease